MLNNVSPFWVQNPIKRACRPRDWTQPGPYYYCYSVSSSTRQWQGKRLATSQAGDHKTGHIQAGPNEGILFLDNVYPLKLQWLLRLTYSGEKYIERFREPTAGGVKPSDIFGKAFKSGESAKIVQVIPRLKDGGAFVKFSHSPETDPVEVERTVRKFLKETPLRPWWNPFHKAHAHLVRGRPWVEDLFRPPSSRLRVEFAPEEGGVDAPDLSHEELYAVFRPYGKLREIVSQPSDSKVLPKYAYLDFASTKRAIMARNCLHGITVKEELGDRALARLKIAYERQSRSSWIKDWLLNHPRIVIPILAALIATVTVAVFDPMRTFFIRTHISRIFHIDDSRVYKWFAARASDLLSFRSKGDSISLTALLDDRRGDIEQIQKWLLESVDNFIVIQGPRGSGKKELVMDHALKNRRVKLLIDCKTIQEARSDSATIDSMADQVGYRPVFSWMNSISGLIDLAAQGATGMKTGFSETLDSQLDKILNNTAAALKQLGLEGRRKGDKDYSLGEDEYLEAHPERRPVVVIDNFLHKSQDATIVYDKLAEWAARVTTANVAHVVFLTTDVSYQKSLSKALPDHAFRSLSLGDFRPSVARTFVLNHLDAEADEIDPITGKKPELTPSQRRKDLGELDGALEELGGRLTDLEFLARRIKAGETPTHAVREIIEQSASEILKMYLLAPRDSQRRWSPEQAWTLVRALAEKNVLRYNELLLDDAFKGSDADSTLAALEQAELITIVSANGRPTSIKPGKPVFQSAFRVLVEDNVLRSRLDISILSEAIKTETASIGKMEDELRLLGGLPKQPKELSERIRWLLAKIQASQMKIESAEAEVGKFKKVMQTEF